MLPRYVPAAPPPPVLRMPCVVVPGESCEELTGGRSARDRSAVRDRVDAAADCNVAIVRADAPGVLRVDAILSLTAGIEHQGAEWIRRRREPEAVRPRGDHEVDEFFALASREIEYVVEVLGLLPGTRLDEDDGYGDRVERKVRNPHIRDECGGSGQVTRGRDINLISGTEVVGHSAKSAEHERRGNNEVLRFEHRSPLYILNLN